MSIVMCLLSNSPAKGMFKEIRKKKWYMDGTLWKQQYEVFNDPYFLFQHITEERYRMQSKPLGICLIIDCIGNDTGWCGCCRLTDAPTVRSRHGQAVFIRSALASIKKQCQNPWFQTMKEIFSLVLLMSGVAWATGSFIPCGPSVALM